MDYISSAMYSIRCLHNREQAYAGSWCSSVDSGILHFPLWFHLYIQRRLAVCDTGARLEYGFSKGVFFFALHRHCGDCGCSVLIFVCIVKTASYSHFVSTHVIVITVAATSHSCLLW